MTVFNRSLRRPGALIAVAAASVLGVGLSAGSASAHNPTWSVDCSSVSIDLTYYGHGQEKVNEVTISAAGQTLLNEKFGESLKKTIDLPKHSAELQVHFSLKAVDDNGKWNREEDKTAPVCPGNETPPASPSPSPSGSTPEETVTPSPSATPSTATPTPTVEPTSSAPVVPSSQPSPAGDNLAETGSSSSTPIIAGAAAVVLVAGAGIMWAARKRRSTQG